MAENLRVAMSYFCGKPVTFKPVTVALAPDPVFSEQGFKFCGDVKPLKLKNFSFWPSEYTTKQDFLNNLIKRGEEDGCCCLFSNTFLYWTINAVEFFLRKYLDLIDLGQHLTDLPYKEMVSSCGINGHLFQRLYDCLIKSGYLNAEFTHGLSHGQIVICFKGINETNTTEIAKKLKVGSEKNKLYISDAWTYHLEKILASPTNPLDQPR